MKLHAQERLEVFGQSSDRRLGSDERPPSPSLTVFAPSRAYGIIAPAELHHERGDADERIGELRSEDAASRSFGTCEERIEPRITSRIDEPVPVRRQLAASQGSANDAVEAELAQGHASSLPKEGVEDAHRGRPNSRASTAQPSERAGVESVRRVQWRIADSALAKAPRIVDGFDGALPPSDGRTMLATMARFGSGAGGYELLVAGRKPRAKFVRCLTPDAAVRRLIQLSASPTDATKIRAELERAGIDLRGQTFEDALTSAVRRQKVVLFRRFALSPHGSSDREFAIPMAALLSPEPEPEPSTAPSTPAPAAASSPPNDARAEELLASALVEAADSGAALCHSCTDCAACRGA